MKTRIFLLAVAAVLWMAAIGQTKTIIERQCWLDGNISSAQNAGASVDISALAPGVHTYSLRVKDSEGVWSTIETRFFVIPRIINPATNIVEREYWLDGNGASRIALDASSAQISLTSLQAGLHYLTMRVRDNNGFWSSPVTRYFIVPASLEPATITRYMYWFDNDTEHFVSGELTSAASVLPVTITHLSEGEHTLSWRVADSKGAWSNTMVESFTFTRIQLTDAMVSLAAEEFEYTGEEIRPAVIVTDGETVLQEGVDYTVSYADNIYPDTASVIVAAAENSLYKGQVTKSFLINKAVPVITTPPVALENLQTSGEPVILISAGEAIGGEMQYSLDGENYSPELPSVTVDGTYTVYYKVIGDENHTDTEPETIVIIVAKTPTGIDKVSSNQLHCAKVVIEGHLYILRGEKLYTITGSVVR